MKNKKLLFTILTFAWVAVIFTFSLQPGDVSGDMSGSLVEKILALFMPGVLDNPEQLEILHFIFRKCAHFTEFMILGVLSSNALQCVSVRYKKFTALVFCVLVASADESLQLFVNERAGRVQDVLIDSAGALAGVMIVLLFLRMNVRKKSLTKL